ncbi:CD40 ligand [Silurus meridionalis]|uniref:THD domain-containing protein n=1 Tax=Silurus meridionalis TaxID=175797 RepID=A0A8T0BM66_SILME|nr:CD40 ligand [Silurus meridionalis]KAF7707323.1 hypothetical protein HF521_018541 [Silurus meridionalis]
MSTMINTFHSSYNPSPGPPPIPPRSSHRGGPVVPSNTPLVKFLSVLLLLLIIQTFGGFVYLFHRINTLQDRRNENEISTLRQLQQCAENNLESEEVQFCSKLVENFKTVLKKVSQAEGRVAFLTGSGAQARMVLNDKINSNTLVWDTTHSVVDKISLSTSGVLTIYYSGYYLIQSQVTFSSADEKAVLKQSLLTQRPNEKGPTELLQSYCSLPRKTIIPDMCTASQAGVFKLEKDQRLYITVNNRSLVHHDSTTFGLFRLQY